jgi:hypothetical protein
MQLHDGVLLTCPDRAEREGTIRRPHLKATQVRAVDPT